MDKVVGSLKKKPQNNSAVSFQQEDKNKGQQLERQRF